MNQQTEKYTLSEILDSPTARLEATRWRVLYQDGEQGAWRYNGYIYIYEAQPEGIPPELFEKGDSGAWDVHAAWGGFPNGISYVSLTGVPGKRVMNVGSDYNRSWNDGASAPKLETILSELRHFATNLFDREKWDL